MGKTIFCLHNYNAFASILNVGVIVTDRVPRGHFLANRGLQFVFVVSRVITEYLSHTKNAITFVWLQHIMFTLYTLSTSLSISVCLSLPLSIVLIDKRLLLFNVLLQS